MRRGSRVRSWLCRLDAQRKPVPRGRKGERRGLYLFSALRGKVDGMGSGSKKPGNLPIGSTQKVGESVSGGRVPEEYDSSPML
jgi:hypothetical protein